MFTITPTTEVVKDSQAVIALRRSKLYTKLQESSNRASTLKIIGKVLTEGVDWMSEMVVKLFKVLLKMECVENRIYFGDREGGRRVRTARQGRLLVKIRG